MVLNRTKQRTSENVTCFYMGFYGHLTWLLCYLPKKFFRDDKAQNVIIII